jgi:hypothetical protein
MTEEGEVCIINIGPRERQKRLRIGIAGFALGAAAAVAMIFMHVAPAWRLFVIGLFIGGADVISRVGVGLWCGMGLVTS